MKEEEEKEVEEEAEEEAVEEWEKRIDGRWRDEAK